MTAGGALEALEVRAEGWKAVTAAVRCHRLRWWRGSLASSSARCQEGIARQ